MVKDTPPSNGKRKSTDAARAARLKAALKANIAKRKEQARVRASDADRTKTDNTE